MISLSAELAAMRSSLHKYAASLLAMEPEPLTQFCIFDMSLFFAGLYLRISLFLAKNESGVVT